MIWLRECVSVRVLLSFVAILSVEVVANGQQAEQAAAPTASDFSLSHADAFLVADGAATTQAAATTVVETKERAPYDILTTKKLTGDWFGARTAMQDVGFTFDPMLVMHNQFNFRGGVETHNADDFAGKWFYPMEFDFGKMKLIPGGSFFIRGIQSWHRGVQADVGSLTPPYWSSGSDGDFFFGDHNCILVDKWWYRQRLLDDRIEIRVGKLLNALDLFVKNQYAGSYATQFGNRALNHVMNFPSAKGLGAFVKVWPTDWLYFSMSAIDPYARASRTGFDTGFHGPADFVGNWEFGLTPKFETANGKLPGNYKFGWWYNPRTLTIYKNTLGGSLRTESQTGDVGFYLCFDQMVWKENNDPKDKQGLGMFFNYGFAHGDVNRIEHFWSLGGQYLGLIPTRDKDVLGLGVAQSMLSNQYRHEVNSRADRETVYELYYAIQITPWCTITPDVQVITNPGGTKDARDALVGGVRVKIDF